MIIGKTIVKRSQMQLGTIETWWKPYWGSVHRKNSTLQQGNLRLHCFISGKGGPLHVLFVALLFFFFTFNSIPCVEKKMKLSSRENSGYIEYFTLYWFSLENRLHEHCVYMTSWQPFWCDGDLCLKVHLNLVPGVTLLLLRWSGKREEKRLQELGCVRQSNPLVFGFFL